MVSRNTPNSVRSSQFRWIWTGSMRGASSALSTQQAAIPVSLSPSPLALSLLQWCVICFRMVAPKATDSLFFCQSPLDGKDTFLRDARVCLHSVSMLEFFSPFVSSFSCTVTREPRMYGRAKDHGFRCVAPDSTRWR